MTGKAETLTISAVLIVRDEAAVLEPCLESIAPVADEIVVVDTGSSDKTIDIARRFTGCIFAFVWIDDFAAARNVALSHATGAYVLQIDADERLLDPEHARERLHAFAGQHSPNTLGTVAIESPYTLGGAVQDSVVDTPRFFKRGAFEYSGAIHEQIVPLSGDARVAPTGVRIHHIGYNRDGKTRAKKAARNRALLERALRVNPRDEYLWYQLGRTEFSEERHEQSVNAFEKMLGFIELNMTSRRPSSVSGASVSQHILSDALATLAYAYANVNRLEDALRLLEHHRALGHWGIDSPDFHHALGYVYLMTGALDASRAAYEKSLEYGAERERVRGTGSFASHYHIGLLDEARGDVDAAIQRYLTAIRIKPDYATTLSRLIDLPAEYGVAPPPELWMHCDHDRFTQIYLDRITQLLQSAEVSKAETLIRNAAAIAEPLLQRCLQHLEDLERTIQDSGNSKPV